MDGTVKHRLLLIDDAPDTLEFLTETGSDH
jgi:hypothetical protein